MFSGLLHKSYQPCPEVQIGWIHKISSSSIVTDIWIYVREMSENFGQSYIVWTLNFAHNCMAQRLSLSPITLIWLK